MADTIGVSGEYNLEEVVLISASGTPTKNLAETVLEINLWESIDAPFITGKLIFNDEVRNQSTISDFKIKGNGEYKRSAIINTIGINIKLRVRDALQTSANEIIIPSQYRNKLRMVKFNF